jgi:hypothetical protein
LALQWELLMMIA